MNGHRIILGLRLVLAIFGILLVLESYFLSPNFQLRIPSISIPVITLPTHTPSQSSWSNDNNPPYDSGWSSDQGGGWQDSSGWQEADGGWDSDGGDSGSW